MRLYHMLFAIRISSITSDATKFKFTFTVVIQGPAAHAAG